jgi:hypothetical protein
MGSGRLSGLAAAVLLAVGVGPARRPARLQCLTRCPVNPGGGFDGRGDDASSRPAPTPAVSLIPEPAAWSISRHARSRPNPTGYGPPRSRMDPRGRRRPDCDERVRHAAARPSRQRFSAGTPYRKWPRLRSIATATSMSLADVIDNAAGVRVVRGRATSQVEAAVRGRLPRCHKVAFRRVRWSELSSAAGRTASRRRTGWLPSRHRPGSVWTWENVVEVTSPVC